MTSKSGRVLSSAILAMLLLSGATAGMPGAGNSEERSESVFDGGDGRFDLESYRMSETLKFSGRKLPSPMVSYAELVGGQGGRQSQVYSGGNSKKKIALAVLASAVLPGMGEFYVWTDTRKLSHLLRAPIFVAIDAYFWYGYRDNFNKGKDVKAQYEAFCDAHWSEERFLLQHPFCDGIGGCDSWQYYNEYGKDNYYYFVYIPKDLDREEYYENCGKYDAFAFGWDDWDGDYYNFKPWTPNRTVYWEMRSESDDYLLRSDQFIMLLIINRVVSMIDAGWLAYRANRGITDEEGWSLDLRPGIVAPKIGLSYRF
jgi:hypothetical protein